MIVTLAGIYVVLPNVRLVPHSGEPCTATLATTWTNLALPYCSEKPLKRPARVKPREYR